MRKVIFLDIDGVLNCNQFHADWIQKHATLHERLVDCERESMYLENRFDSLFTNVTDSPFFNGYIAPPNLGRWNTMIEILKDAEIVFSSDWRFIQDGTYSNLASLDKIKELFKVRGINGNVVGATPYVKNHNRGTEISDYLFEHINEYDLKQTRFLVFDDLDIHEDIKDAFYRTHGALLDCKIDSEYGLTADSVGVAFRWFEIMGQ